MVDAGISRRWQSLSATVLRDVHFWIPCDRLAGRTGGAPLDQLIPTAQRHDSAVHSPLVGADRLRKLQSLGIVCGFGAGAWLGAAEAPTKLVSVGISPVVVSLLMVAGVFLARWSLPALIRGTGQIGWDLRQAPHLVVWGVLAGCLWAVANTLTIFAIRDVGLSIAFPLWNMNSLIGILWGITLFNELRNAGALRWLSVLGGALLMFLGACLLAYASSAQTTPEHAMRGIAAALAAGVLWGTMYVPYRKAYLTGMNPLVVRGILHDWRTRHHDYPGGQLQRRRVASFARAAEGERSALLAAARRLRLGHRRRVSAVRRQVCGHQPRHSFIEHQPIMGNGVGHSCVRRVAWAGACRSMRR